MRSILTNAQIVDPHQTRHGSLVIEDGQIAEILPGEAFADGEDLVDCPCGDYHFPSLGAWSHKWWMTGSPHMTRFSW